MVKTYNILSVDSEKAFDKSEHQFIIKSGMSSQTQTGMELPYPDKRYLRKSYSQHYMIVVKY